MEKRKKSCGPADVRYFRGKSNDPAKSDWMRDLLFSRECVCVWIFVVLNEEIVPCMKDCKMITFS